jgi:hypothetical protein
MIFGFFLVFEIDHFDARRYIPTLTASQNEIVSHNTSKKAITAQV